MKRRCIALMLAAVTMFCNSGVTYAMGITESTYFEKKQDVETVDKSEEGDATEVSVNTLGLLSVDESETANSVGKIEWNYDAETRVLTIGGTGRMPDYASGDAVPWNDYRSEIIQVIIGDGITGIGRYAFYSCENLKKVVLGKSVSQLGESAFERCYNLTDLEIHSNIENIGVNTFFVTRDYIKKLYVGRGVTALDDELYSFGGLEKIGVEEGNSSYESDNGVLYNKGKTELIRYPRKKADITEYQIAESVTKVRDYAFYDCESLTSVEVPSKVERIGEYAFEYCENLEKVVLGERVKELGESAFARCYNLADLEVRSDIEVIGANAFFTTGDYIKKLYVGREVTALDDELYSFGGLEKIEVEEGNSSYESDNGVLYNKGKTELIRYPCKKADITEYQIAESVTKVRDYAFYDCESLTSVEVPSKVEKIGEYAFEYCEKLEKVVLGEGVKELGASAFGRCYNLAELEVRSDIEGIGANAFFATGDYIENLYVGREVTALDDTFYSFNGLEEIAVEEGNSSYESDNGVLYNKGKTELIRYPRRKADITEYQIAESVTEVRDYAFYDCESLTSVEVPSKVEKIGEYAFEYCEKLEKVVLGEGVKELGVSAFGRCYNLAELEVRSDIEGIGANAFFVTGDHIKKLYVGREVTALDDELYSFGGLEEIAVEEGNSSYESDNGVLYNKGKTELIRYPRRKADITEYQIAESVTEVRDYAFYDCESLTSVEVPSKVEKIGEYAFEYCEKLEKVVLGEGVKELGASAFGRCYNLAELEVRSDIEGIGANAFFVTGDHIKKLYVGREVTALDDELYSFGGLEEIAVEEGNSSYESDNGVLYNKGKTELIRYPRRKADITEYQIVEGVTHIEEEAFYDCDGLERVIIPESVTEIGKEAFYDCDKLGILNIPTGVKKVDEYAFAGCDNLMEAQIPDSVTSISSNAFQSCPNLIIYCNVNSTAAKYADEHNVPYVTSTHCISFSLKKNCSAMSEEQKIAISEDIQKYNVKIVKLDTGESLAGYRIYANNIVLKVGSVLPEEQLLISLESKTGETVSYQTTVTLDDDLKGNVDMVVQQKGYVSTVPDTSGMTTVLIYDEDGNLCDVMSSEGKVCTSTFLNNGTYRVLYILGDAYLWEFGNIDEFYNNPDLMEGESFVIRTVNISNGVITDLGMVKVPEIDTELLMYLDSDECSYYANTNEISAGGLITIRTEYAFKEMREDDISNMELSVKIPNGSNYVTGSLVLDGKIIENVTESDSELRVPLTSSKGVIHFNIRPIAYGTLISSAQISFTTSGGRKTESIGTIDVDVPYITLNCADTSADKTIEVSGLTVPKTKVGIYDGLKRVGTTTSSSSGKWSTKITLSNAMPDTVHPITAKIYMGTTEEMESECISVAYSPEAITVQQFVMYYNGGSDKKIDLTNINYMKKPVISFNPAYPFTFTVKLSGNEGIREVQIVSTKNGQEKTMEAFYDASTGLWVASGYFDNNRSYVPGVLSVRYAGEMSNYMVELNAQDDTNIEELPEIIKEGTCVVNENTYDKNTDTGSYSVTYTLADAEKTQVDFRVSQERVSGRDYSSKELVEDGYFKVDTDDDTSVYYTKTFDNGDGEYITRTIRFKKEYTDDYGSSFTEVAYSKLESRVKSTFIDQAEGAIPGIGLASKMWDTTKSVISIGGNLYDLDEAKYRLLRMNLPSEEFSARFEALQALETSYWLYLVGKAIITGASTYATIAFPGVGSAIKFGIGFLSSFIYAYYDDWFDAQMQMLMDCDLRWSIDPSGYVYEAVEKNRLEGVKATIYYRDEDGKEVLWDASEYEQDNPLYTDQQGTYAWDVSEGLWRVKLEKEGYETVFSEWLPVPPVQTGINIGMVSLEKPVVQSCELYEDHAVIIFNKYMKVDTLNSETVKILDEEGNVINGRIEAMDVDNTSGVALATEFFIWFDRTISSELYTVTVDKKVSSYAGINLEQNYTERLSALKTIEGITIDIPQSVVVKQEIEIPVKIETRAESSEFTIFCKSSMNDIAEVLYVTQPDDTGYAYVYVTTKLPGVVTLTVGIEGTSIQNNVELNILQEPIEETEENKGDINEDGHVNITDLMICLHHVSGRTLLDEQKLASADIDGNGSVNITDLMRMLHYVSGRTETL